MQLQLEQVHSTVGDGLKLRMSARQRLGFKQMILESDQQSRLASEAGGGWWPGTLGASGHGPNVRTEDRNGRSRSKCCWHTNEPKRKACPACIVDPPIFDVGIGRAVYAGDTDPYS